MRALLLILILISKPVFSDVENHKEEIKQSIKDIFSTSKFSGFSGVVLIALNDEEIFYSGFGKSDIQKNIDFSRKTLVDVGSITKQFTASAILKLKMLGKLSVQDRAGRFVPSLKGEVSDVTIHELLTHTAGITTETGDDYQTFSAQDLVDHLNKVQLSYIRGSHHYSNLGYSLLALIVENISGLPIDQFLSKFYFTPIGMSKTGYTYPSYIDAEVAHGYLDGKDWGYPHQKNWSSTGPYWNLRGNGGMLSTAEDMLRWHQALHFGDYLSEDSKKGMFSAHVKETDDYESYYGYGWVIEILNDGNKVIWHNGGNGIFGADVRYYPSTGLYYFIAGNKSGDLVFDISEEIHRALTRIQETSANKSIQPSAKAPAD